MRLFTFFFPFPSPPSRSRELVLVNVEDHNMITPKSHEIKSLCFKEQGGGGSVWLVGQRETRAGNESRLAAALDFAQRRRPGGWGFANSGSLDEEEGEEEEWEGSHLGPQTPVSCAQGLGGVKGG